ncbi:MAG: glycoside hydrolase family 27 protein [Lachnospiraceae bacterium]|nr:glycoside hydrolase family 27 protein [Lachnospiraceae bacterium]
MNFKTPPMGWNSWDCYGAAVTEDVVRKNADYMAKYLKPFGWEYVVVDIQWYEPKAVNNEYRPFTDMCMDEYGRFLPAPERFPSAADGKGFKPLADYVHSLGLKFGIHMMRGIPRQAVHKNTPVLGTDKTARDVAKTASICVWNTDNYGLDPHKEGAREYYDSIFKLYASWGVDFIKCDDICRELPHEEEELVMLSESLHNSGRNMTLSLSPGPALLEKAELYKEVSNMWRITDDFWDKWELLYAMFERAEKWCTHTGNGHWPDCDMLPIGALRQCYDENEWTKFTEDEQITMMSLWCIMRAPLMIGAEMTKFDDFSLKLVTNEDILSMLKYARNSHQVWKKKIDGNEFILWTAGSVNGGNYVALFNTSDVEAIGTFGAEDIEIEALNNGKELWSGEKLADTDRICTKVPAHGAKVYYFS